MWLSIRLPSIISAVIYWVSSTYSPVDQEVYIQMKEFANSVTSSSFMGEKAREIILAIDQRVRLSPVFELRVTHEFSQG
jgi:hypothetical protein